MISSAFLATALLASGVSYVRAANDWNKPCFQGDCSYDIPATDNTMPAALRIVSASSFRAFPHFG
jgi:hypothetical protein